MRAKIAAGRLFDDWNLRVGELMSYVARDALNSELLEPVYSQVTPDKLGGL
jgi:hypothetical protein